MLDDDRLAELFGRAADVFEVPASGPAEILARAERPAEGAVAADEPGVDDAEDEGARAETPVILGRRRRFAATARRHRVLSVAAVAVVALVLAGGIGAVVRSPSGRLSSLAVQHAEAAHGGGAVNPAPGAKAPAAGKSGSQGLDFAPSGAAAPSGSGAASGTQNQSVPSLPQGAVGQSAKIEQTGTLDLTVDQGDVARTMTSLTNLTSSVGGFVANSQSQNGSGGATAYGTITMEVPVNDFANVLKAAERFGKTTNVSTNATDVTGQYVDLQARLSALEASRQQYLTILAKATSIGDILSVQEQLDSIQQQIEQLQGQLQVLTSETSYSKVNVTVSEGTPPPRPGPLPESGLVQAWHDSVGGFTDGVEGVVRLAGPFLFALLCLALVAVGGRVLWRRYQRHRL